jgi:hypothetical protein
VLTYKSKKLEGGFLVEQLKNFVDSISGVEDNFIAFVGQQLSNIQHSGVELLDTLLSTFGYK